MWFLFFFLMIRVSAQRPDPHCQRTTVRPPPLDVEEQFSRGPLYGTLLVAGGGVVTNSKVYAEFLDLAGGPEHARIIYCPTNGGGSYDTDAQRERELQNFIDSTGFTSPPLLHPVKLIHTYNRTEADSEEFYRLIDDSNGIWFRGGLPFYTYDAYFSTETEKALDRMLQRGGVVAGTSAGALMQSNLMLRGDRTRSNNIVLGDPYEGFAFGQMKNIVFDVHNLARNRAHDMLEIFTLFPLMLGINIDEDTAVIFRDDIIEVMGTGWVQIFDPTLWQKPEEVPYCADFRLSGGSGRTLVPGGGKSHFLSSKRRDKYNVVTRETISSLTQADIDAMLEEETWE